MNPFFHCFGYKAGWMACLQQGAAALPLAVLDPEALLGLIERERASALPGPPTMFVSLLDAADRDVDLSSLRIGFVGVSTVAPVVLRGIRAELPFEALTTGYGLTECTAMVSVTRPDDEPEHVAEWNGGYPIEGVEVAIADDREILVRGLNVMRGYYRDPESTVAVDADGWLHTGDIGMLDSDGALRISDRKKDIYISGGFNVSPAEVENLLLGHEAVGQAAVIGVPGYALGEVGVAFVAVREGASLTPDELVAWTRERIANDKVPRRVELVADLPLNASGKIVKDELRGEQRCERRAEAPGRAHLRHQHCRRPRRTPRGHRDRGGASRGPGSRPSVRRHRDPGWHLPPPVLGPAAARTCGVQQRRVLRRPWSRLRRVRLPRRRRQLTAGERRLHRSRGAGRRCARGLRSGVRRGPHRNAAFGAATIDDATFVGIGQSLGGFVTMIQQGKYHDYPAVGIFGASPRSIVQRCATSPHGTP